MTREIAVVMGNGTSVAFNAELTSDALATAVSARLPRRLVRAADNAASDRGRGDPRANFEDLLGPLDRMAAALGPLRSVARVAGPALAAQVDATERMVRGLYAKGVGAALAIVAERSTAYHGAELDAYSRFPRWVLRRPHRDEDAIVRFFNLNYDSLLDSRLLEYAEALGYSLADQADGRESRRRRLRPLRTGSGTVTGLRLRDPDDPEYLTDSRSVIAYHLHGSLAWLRDPTTDRVYKAASLEKLRDDLDFFECVANGDATLEPVVVLTDRKRAAIAREPFASAYRVLQTSVATADTLIIAGYGFGDIPLNTALGDALAARTRLPRVAVIGYGRARAVRNVAVRKLGRTNRSLRGAIDARARVCGHGLPTAIDCLKDWGR